MLRPYTARPTARGARRVTPGTIAFGRGGVMYRYPDSHVFYRKLGHE